MFFTPLWLVDSETILSISIEDLTSRVDQKDSSRKLCHMTKQMLNWYFYNSFNIRNNQNPKKNFENLRNLDGGKLTEIYQNKYLLKNIFCRNIRNGKSNWSLAKVYHIEQNIWYFHFILLWKYQVWTCNLKIAVLNSKLWKLFIFMRPLEWTIQFENTTHVK